MRRARPTAPAPVRVETAVAGESDMSTSRNYSGTVEESSGTVASFSVPGTVQTMNVSAGDYVKKGQLIATVDAASLKNAYDISNAALTQAQDAYNRMKMLHDAEAIADIKWVEMQQTLRQAQSAEAIARKTLNDANLYAPLSGYVSEKYVDAGMTAAPGLPVVKIVSIDPVKVSISIPENEIASIPDGADTDISVSALGGKRFTGKIVEKGVSANPITRSYDVKITVDNPDGELLPGMICDVTLNTDTVSRSLTVPLDAVMLASDNSHYVWLDSAGYAVRRSVDTGALTDEGIVINSGIARGDSLIVKGQQKVSRGSKLTVINKQ
ncbi:MAG: efflux RND transporter periplasmic adaptor subunit [Muribaculaceae bacterium]|nr:efflux RND transporter periplasmic adaptor subunit [Muribaculaceae bacterium]